MSSFFSFLKVYIYSVKKKSFNYHQFTTAINCNFANIFRIWWFLFHKRCQTKDARIFFDFDFKPANLEHDARYQILNCKSSLKNFSKFCKCLKKMERLKENNFFGNEPTFNRFMSRNPFFLHKGSTHSWNRACGRYKS